MDQKTFLECHNISREDFDSAGLKWELLREIHDHHVAASQELQTTARYITERLQPVTAIHSIKLRIKDPSHLVEKIIRKKVKAQDLAFDVSSYEGHITDLIGIRALHLFKGDWKEIHEFVKTNWALAETPVAYVRRGDPDGPQAAFKEAGCDVQEHPFGYRSIHYLIKSQPAKRIRVAELQVRTIFEEGWSEIDHRVRYPRQSDDPYWAGLLAIFNRFAGGADEMGTYTRLLSTFLSEQALKEAERQEVLSGKEDQLKRAVSELKISEAKKEELARQISELRQSSSAVTIPAFPDVGKYSTTTISGRTLANFDGSVVTFNMSTPSVCRNFGRKFTEPMGGNIAGMCSDCILGVVWYPGTYLNPE